MMEEVNEFDFESRIVSSDYDSIEDGEVENCLRPKVLDEYVGQQKGIFQIPNVPRLPHRSATAKRNILCSHT